MRLSDVMHRHVATVRASDGLELAARTMAWSEVRHLPVLEGTRLVGLLSEHDLLRHRDAPGDTPVARAMISPVQTASPDDSVEEAAERVLEHRLGCLPVVDDEQLVGLVTKSELLAALARPPESVGAAARLQAWALMTADPLTARLDDYLLDAAARMSSASVRHLPVVDVEGRVVGVLSDRDVRRAIGDLGALVADPEVRTRVSLARVADVATRGPLTVGEDEALEEIARLMSRFHVGAVPVVDETGSLTGIVSYLDVIGVLTGERPARPASARAPAHHH